MIRLPDSPRRSDLRAFGLAFGCLVALLSAVAGVLGGLASPLLWAAGLGLGTASVLVASETVATRTYARWNWLARQVSRGSSLWIIGVAFVVIAVVGRAGSRLSWRIPPSPRSGWTEKQSLDSRAFAGQGSEVVSDTERGGWIGALARWGAHGHGWVWGLVPFLVLLSLVHRGGVRAPTDVNYTLY